MTLKEIVQAGPVSRFERYSDGILFYVTSAGFRFRIPVAHLIGGALQAEERTIGLMRWIKAEIV